MLIIGSRDELHVRHEKIPLGCGLRLLYASDLHLTPWTPHIVDQLHQVVRTQMPDIVLLGGDLVDLIAGLPLLGDFIRAQRCPVWAVEGNHDVMVGLPAVRRYVETAGGCWLDQPVEIGAGSHISSIWHHAPSSKAILCTHNPAIFPEAAGCGYRVVLAGHLHGGQCVLNRKDGKLYPASWFFSWCGERFTCGDSTLLVSRGVNDTLPIRWNCPREVILCSC